MIEHVSIKNFAIIANTEVDFEKGLNIITGETGAGKSIVIEAISLALGQRADNSLIRHGEEKAIIELLGTLDGEEVILQREISLNGKNICKVNGELTTLQMLNNKAKKIADIHGQYDNQSLLNPEYHIELLDTFQKENTLSLKEEVKDLFNIYLTKKHMLMDLLNREKDNARSLDVYKYQYNEIDSLHLEIGEDVELENKINLLSNSEKIYECIENAYNLLLNEESSILSSLSTINKSINDISKYSNKLQEISYNINDAYYKIDDAANSLSSVRDSLSFSPKELDDALLRMSKIDDIKKKFGNSILDVLKYKDELEKKLNLIENFDEEKSKLQNEFIQANKDLLVKCAELTTKRKAIALELESRIESELKELNFKDAKIKIDISSLDHPTENGIDNVSILISTNIGEPLKPLEKVVSGGEMSRIMLAFKNVISTYDQIDTLIFDEIDNGISGQTAAIVGSKLKEIAKNHQIICITHLPQIAAKGETNFAIIKESDNSKTYTEIKKLDTKDKVKEIARLIGGTIITENTLKSAMELIVEE